MSDTKPIPCPFCGNPDSLYRNPALGKFQEYCDKGKARGPERDNLNDATVAWNTRALTPKQKAAPEMFEALKAALPLHEANGNEQTAAQIRAALAKAGQP